MIADAYRRTLFDEDTRDKYNHLELAHDLAMLEFFVDAVVSRPVADRGHYAMYAGCDTIQ